MQFLYKSQPMRVDKEVIDLVAYFNTEERFRKWNKLTAQEIDVIAKEITRCKDDFIYWARNYCKIITKDREPVSLVLNESQEIIWMKLCELWDRNLPLKIMILKARQLGCSTLVEAIICWYTIFHANVNALVVSYDPEHAAYLFSLSLTMIDSLPWWMQPMIASRKFEEGIILDNPDYASRQIKPGLNSRISVQGANKYTGVGQGLRIDAAHVSEYSDYSNAREIIEGDLGNAIKEGREGLAILESTGKKAGGYAHKLWIKNIEMGEQAEFVPLFIPAFFESKRRRTLPTGWTPDTNESDIAKRFEREWIRCDNFKCKQFYPRMTIQGDRARCECPRCEVGILQPCKLDPEQLHWYEIRRKNANKDQQSLKEFLQEMAITAEDAFQNAGYQYYPQATQDFVKRCVEEPIYEGHFDSFDRLHAPDWTNGGKCRIPTCGADHALDENNVQVWRMPIEGCEYTIGVDVAEGIGVDGDYSVAWVNHVRKRGPDEQVAMFRSNTVDPIGLAYIVKSLGKMYNEALVAVEINRFDRCLSYLQLNLQYPNLYRPRNRNTTSPGISSRVGWSTDFKTKPAMCQSAVRYLKAEMWIVRSSNFVQEMKTFNKESQDDQTARSNGDFKDDELMAAMIALHTSHEHEIDESLGYVPIEHQKNLTLENSAWIGICKECDFKWPVEEPVGYYRCGKCSSPKIQFHRNDPTRDSNSVSSKHLFSELEAETDGVRHYDHL